MRQLPFVPFPIKQETTQTARRPKKQNDGMKHWHKHRRQTQWQQQQEAVQVGGAVSAHSSRRQLAVPIASRLHLNRVRKTLRQALSRSNEQPSHQHNNTDR
nr:MAG TPA: hypothetical protein [Caudoviricetes sp.]